MPLQGLIVKFKSFYIIGSFASLTFQFTEIIFLCSSIIYSFTPITIVRLELPRDWIQFSLLDIHIKLEMNLLHAYGTKLDCKYLKVRLRDTKRPYISFYGLREERLYIQGLLTKQVSCRVRNALNISIMSTTLSIYISILTICE